MVNSYQTCFGQCNGDHCNISCVFADSCNTDSENKGTKSNIQYAAVIFYSPDLDFSPSSYVKDYSIF